MAAQGRSDGVVRGYDHTETLRELISKHAEADSAVRVWEKHKDEALGPVVSASYTSSLKGKEKSGHGISKRERDGLRLRTADAEWIAEARKVVSSW